MASAATRDDDLPARVRELPSWMLSRAHLRAHQLLVENLQAVGFRGYHYRLLAALEEFGPASQAVLGQRTFIDRSDVVTALDELSTRGFVNRSPDTADRRRNVITITPEGTAQLLTLDEVIAQVQDDLLSALSPAERARFLVLLTRVQAEHLGRTPSTRGE